MQNELLTALGQSLVTGNLTDEALLARTAEHPVVQILPDANVVKAGGQSFIDRGRAAVFPLIDEISANLGRHKMIIDRKSTRLNSSHAHISYAVFCLKKK